MGCVWLFAFILSSNGSPATAATPSSRFANVVARLVITSRPTAGARHLVRITEIAFGGDGVARLEDGRVLFTPFVAVDGGVEVEII